MSAISHQAQRLRDEHGCIVATLDDYRAIYELVAEVVGEGVQATVSGAVREAVEAVGELIAEASSEAKPTEVSITQLAERLGIDKSSASRRAQRAAHEGYLVNLEDRRGKPARYVPGEPLPATSPVLPHPDALTGGEGWDIPRCNTATVQHLFGGC